MYCKPRNNGMQIEDSFCSSPLVQLEDDPEISRQAAIHQNVLAYIRTII